MCVDKSILKLTTESLSLSQKGKVTIEMTKQKLMGFISEWTDWCNNYLNFKKRWDVANRAERKILRTEYVQFLTKAKTYNDAIKKFKKTIEQLECDSPVAPQSLKDHFYTFGVGSQIISFLQYPEIMNASKTNKSMNKVFTKAMREHRKKCKDPIHQIEANYKDFINFCENNPLLRPDCRSTFIAAKETKENKECFKPGMRDFLNSKATRLLDILIQHFADYMYRAREIHMFARWMNDDKTQANSEPVKALENTRQFFQEHFEKTPYSDVCEAVSATLKLLPKPMSDDFLIKLREETIIASEKLINDVKQREQQTRERMFRQAGLPMW